MDWFHPSRRFAYLRRLPLRKNRRDFCHAGFNEIFIYFFMSLRLTQRLSLIFPGIFHSGSNMGFDCLEAFRTDHMFNAAGILSSNFAVYTKKFQPTG